MQVRSTAKIAATIALASALVVPTAAWGAQGDHEATTTYPGNGYEVIDQILDDQLYVGVPTPVESFGPFTTSATWLRGGAVVASTVGYTPVAADRGQVLTRVLVYLIDGTPTMAYRQTFVSPVK